ncbi:MAG: hypothetical protein AB1894_28835 [Chloroflexota bacterium]
MVSTNILSEVLTLAEAVVLSRWFGHPLDRANLVRYAQDGRLAARKSSGTWLTTRSALRQLILALETESRGRPRRVHLSKDRTVVYNRSPELAAALAGIQELRQELRAEALPPEQEAHLWNALEARAIYHTNHLEGNLLTFEDAQAIIEAQRANSEARQNHDRA